MDDQQLLEYLNKLAAGTISEAEYQRFNEWTATCNDEQYERVLELWETIVNEGNDFEPVNPALLARIANSIKLANENDETVPLYPRRDKHAFKWLAVAASLILVIVGGIYFTAKQQKPQQPSNMVVKAIMPGSGQAILKTAGGKKVLLDSLLNGSVTTSGAASISKSGGQQLTYNASAVTVNSGYDTIQIPAGGRPYRIILNDGSKILLNAATILAIPQNISTTSRGQLRLITGEIYAVIVHNSSAPLTIKTPDQLIDDVGTRFDVEAYPDADSKTTLEEGEVMVNGKSLMPGKQALTVNEKTIIKPADVEQALAWTQGYFRFNGDNIQTIMKEVARWYNVDVVYEGKLTTEAFYGKISRSKNINEVLKMLEKTKFVHFKVQGRRVTVYSKK